MIKGFFRKIKNTNALKSEHMNLLHKNLLNADFDVDKFENELAETYDIEPKNLQSITKDNRIKGVSVVVENAIKDDVLTKDEISDIDLAFNRLGLTMEDLPKKLENELKTNLLYYAIENYSLEELAQQNVNIRLPKTEKCFIQQHNINWIEQRSVTRRINYGGVTARVKIAKGLYYSAGSIAPDIRKENIWKSVDAGDFYLTNKRLILVGTKSRNIPLNKILNIELFKDGILITKDTGRPVLLQGDLNFYALYLMMYRLMDEMNN